MSQPIHQPTYRMLPAITGFFVAILLISNIASSKLVQLGYFTFDGGTILFPLSYIFGDILTEVYGFRIARRTIWIGLAAQLLAVVTFAFVGSLPYPSEWMAQSSYDSILTTTLRIVAASIIAYLFGSWANDALLSVMKRMSKGKRLWQRTIGSTIIGEGIDTTLFCVIAFAGSMSTGLLLTVILSNYIFKVAIEIFATPVTYFACAKLKKVEGVDVIDQHHDYSPFSWSVGTPSTSSAKI
ncbi:MAG: queuosine precursor transporter [bacterium]|nr:queuosine precursor transporter [bacterium]